MKKLYYILFIALTSSIFLAFNFIKIKDCPLEGSDYTKPIKELSEEDKEVNRNKNRSAKVPEDISPKELKLDDILKGTKAVKDEVAFSVGEYVEINDGYIIYQEEKGPETCNCGQGNSSKHTGDVHIFLGHKGTTKSQKERCIVVEITPSYKKLHPDYDIKSLVGKNVTVRGYLLYDFEHKGNSVNYCKKGAVDVWRKTCWEIHPITYIDLTH